MICCFTWLKLRSISINTILSWGMLRRCSRQQSNYNRANDVAVWQPTPKTADVTLTTITGYVRVCILMNRWFFCIHSFYDTATLLNMSLSPAMNMWLTDAADGGCGGGLDFAPMRAMRSVGQCDINIPSLSTRGSRSNAVANDYRHEYWARVWTLNPIHINYYTVIIIIIHTVCCRFFFVI